MSHIFSTLGLRVEKGGEVEGRTSGLSITEKSKLKDCWVLIKCSRGSQSRIIALYLSCSRLQASLGRNPALDRVFLMCITTDES